MLPVVAELHRKKKQVDTLRQMLANADEIIAAVEKIKGERELSGDEQTELDALIVRRERIDKSLREAES
jgi:hypothetical protein